jgi:hypothetical protein
MKKLFIIIAFFSLTINLFGQVSSDSIQIKKRLGPVFQQNGKNLTPAQLLNITKSNPDANAEMKIANNNYVASLFFQIPGGFLIGYPIGTALGGGKPNWTLVAIGAGLVVVGIPLVSGYNRHATNAVHIYNTGLKSSAIPTSSMSLRFTTNGVGFRISF